jgi:hypothetical protein
MNLLTFLYIVAFLIGLFFYVKNAEGFTNNQASSGSPRCPNMLIQKGSKFYLYNSKLAQVPGVNPIEFANLEDYTEFLDWQRSQNIRCPVLYVQETYDAQGNRVYKSRPSVSEPQGGLPPSALSPSAEAPVGIASQVPPLMETSLDPLGEPAYPNPTLLVDANHNDPPYNKNSYPGYDPTSYYVGTTTPLDAMDKKKEKAVLSDNAMDPNWGGSAYTQSLLDKGYYKGNEVSIAIE